MTYLFLLSLVAGVVVIPFSLYLLDSEGVLFEWKKRK